MTLTQLPLTTFIETTASGEPVPGGGSVSALCGALAGALATMVCHLTIGKKKYLEVTPEMESLVAKMKPAIESLTAAVDSDSEAYDRVFAAYRLPKDTDEQKAERTAAIQEALRHAAMVPLEVAKISASLMPMIAQVAQHGNTNAATDAYVAALCACTAILGACANVRINLGSISDTTYVSTTTTQVEALETLAVEAEADARITLMNSLQ